MAGGLPFSIGPDTILSNERPTTRTAPAPESIPGIFVGQIRDQVIRTDPILVRHRLLTNTQGRAWGIIPAFWALTDEIERAGQEVALLRDDLLKNPPTEEELKPLPPPVAPDANSETGPTHAPYRPPTRQQQAETLDAQIAIALVRRYDIAVNLAMATAATFGLPMFDEQTGVGYTCEELLDLLKQYMEYADQKKSASRT